MFNRWLMTLHCEIEQKLRIAILESELVPNHEPQTPDGSQTICQRSFCEKSYGIQNTFGPFKMSLISLFFNSMFILPVL